MDITIVYESLFGNTRRVAEAIAEGARDAHPSVRVRLSSTGEAPSDDTTAADLLIVGGPTHALRMSTASSRRQGSQPGKKGVIVPQEVSPDVPGAREWLASLVGNAGRGRDAAAFDTRLSFPLAGGAARPIARGLRHHGYHLVAPPEGFIVSGAHGPLRGGEEVRAKAWGTELARREARRRALAA